MKITNLKLINFRNYTLTELAFPAMINVFFGANAQGKTNLLESIYYGALGLSHRTSNEDELVRFRSEGLAVQVRFEREDAPHNLQLKRYLEQEKVKKIILLDEKKISAREHYGFLKVILFSPEDLAIIKGDPAQRRRFLDMGLTPKTKVMVRKKAPLGDPIEIFLRGYELTLRLDDANKITVAPEEP